MPPIGHKDKRPRPLTAVGAYIFAGGFTVGVKKAGFDVLGHLEDDPPYGAEVVKLNFPGLPIYTGYDEWPLDVLASKQVDFVYGNPPCAAWSGNNHNSHVPEAWKTDPRVSCTRKHFSLVAAVNPKVWAWESVTQAPGKGKELVDELTEEALSNGFSVTQLFHDAATMGTPQTRKRWFLVVHRVEVDFDAKHLLAEIPAVEALAKVKPVGLPAYDSGNNASFNKHLSKMPPGTRLRAWQEKNLVPPGGWTIKDNGHFKGRVGFGHVRLKDRGPASATVGYSMVHPVEHRFMTINEVQAIAGFPQSYKFTGSKNGAKDLDYIARGVCPPVGEWLARRVAEAIKKNVRVLRPTSRVIDLISKGR